MMHKLNLDDFTYDQLVDLQDDVKRRLDNGFPVYLCKYLINHVECNVYGKTVSCDVFRHKFAQHMGHSVQHSPNALLQKMYRLGFKTTRINSQLYYLNIAMRDV